eukprot:489587-Hanusia_phi.AAC.1
MVQLSDWVPTAVMGIRWVGDSLEGELPLDNLVLTRWLVGNPLLQGIADAKLIAPLAVKKM